VLKHLPNFLTCCNLICGCFGIVAVFDQNLILASYFMWTGGVFDFFDGFAARMVKVNSELGKQLDSLADMVTFGVLPGMMVFHLIKNALTKNPEILPQGYYLEYIAFMIILFSALRLAKFNIDTRQSDDFIGLNTPANSIFFSSFPFLLQDESLSMGKWVENPLLLLVLVVVFSLLMVSEIRIIGFKFKDFSFRNNKIRYIFLLCAITLFVIFKFVAIPLIIILYITLSLVQQYLLNKS
jgi:CDP-diacylglycerol---serine O-phosphatidyltransferase